MKMIVFAPSLDPATAANAAVAHSLITATDVALIGGLATRASLLTEMAAVEVTAMMLMAHGSEVGVFDNNEACALGIDDCPVLEGRHVFAWACSTTAQLGRAAAASGATWIGYRATVAAPSEDPDLLPGFQALFSDIKVKFEQVNCETSASQFLRWLKDACDTLIVQFEQSLNELVECSALMCCSHLWRYADVCLPNGAVLEHANAVQPFIDI